ncbi:hypothetical protein OGY18_26245 [Citrobacter sp. Cpo142]|jgi:hypothetical protein|uniref:hypothetical protein n=1 Tax=Citrobacter sp. Cpo142 TaxID=2985151 RepID=UPI002577615B|nr:hypothetical protein [Citrobacter sp. Cpo142]MDM2780580.1 hypothetical protein [Citrobacter sp. Cpo142]
MGNLVHSETAFKREHMPNLSALDSWLKVSTWDTHHPLDQQRFFKAVYQLILSNDKLVEPQYVHDYIVDYKGGNKNAEHVDNIATIYAAKYDDIYSFIYENQIELN